MNKKYSKWTRELNRAVPSYKPSQSNLKNSPAHLVHAKNHVNRAVVVSFDFNNFFSSINSIKIYGVFNKYFRLPPYISFLLTNLTTYNNALPQGAPTSPFLSNLAMYHFDKNMINLSKRNGVKYSRYADDIVLSSNENMFLNNKYFFKSPFKNREKIEFSEEIWKLLSDLGLSINERKTRVYHYWNQQKITGIVVNHHTNVSRKDLVVHRAILINLIKALDITCFKDVGNSEELKSNIDRALSVLKIDNSFLNESPELMKDNSKKTILNIKLIHFILFSKTQYYSQIVAKKSRRIEKIMLISNRLNLLLTNIIADENVTLSNLPTGILNKTGVNNNCTFYFESK